VAWSPDGKTLAFGRHSVQLWEAGSTQLFCICQRHTGVIRALAYSPDGKSFASASNDKTVRLWDSSSCQFLRTLQAMGKSVEAVVWSPDGKTLGSGEEGGSVRLWEADSGKLLRTLTGHTSTAAALAWSPDGKTLASGSNDSTLRLWDAGSGQHLCTLKGHTNHVYALAWSADGKTLASAGRDGTVRFWDAHAEHLLRTVPGPVAGGGVFSPDRRLLAVAYPSGVQVWDTETGQPCITMVVLRDEQYLTVTADGHYRGTPQVERHLVYVVQTDRGQETLSPEEFAAKYGWKNDPERVRLTNK
jgi:WD40 repeat protein